MTHENSFEKLLSTLTREGTLYETLPDNKVMCYACAHLCKIKDGAAGVCRIRFNQGGILRVPYGYVAALQSDPIEKKPFFHVMPGSQALSFGMFGCDMHCAYCQNWISSQALIEPTTFNVPQKTSPEEIILQAIQHQAPVIVSTYNEPLITSEWALAIFKKAKSAGFKTAFVSNGNASEKVLEYLKPYLDMVKVDLKSFNEKHYRFLGGQLKTVLSTIRLLYAMKFWLEIVTLVIPGFNDSDEELSDIAEFIHSVSPDIPWHVTAFHRDYKMLDHENTSTATLLRAVQIGEKAGLRYIYAGNIPGAVGSLENTYCPECKTLLIKRNGFHVHKIFLSHGHCPNCRALIPGIWE
ncbi:MAG: AmmeMemoRadiSam system radical SAM enzyme [Chlamydiota bacterium]|nr:AmmeMemoRadiSam system radical SAM enzyme [Chlamydiota bacterium]